MHQWVASYPSIAFSLEGSPNTVTSSQSVVDIVPTHCAKKENIQVVRIVLIHFFLLIQIPFGSKIAFQGDKVVYHHGYVQPPQMQMVRPSLMDSRLHPTAQIQMVRPSLIDSRLRPPPQNSTFGACSCRSLHLKNSIPDNSMQ
jgi:hypothetical protein